MTTQHEPLFLFIFSLTSSEVLVGILTEIWTVVRLSLPIANLHSVERRKDSRITRKSITVRVAENFKRDGGL